MTRGIQRGYDPQAFADARRKAGLSLPDLARLSGVSEDAIRSWEDGSHLPEIRSLRKAVRPLGATMGHVVKIPKNERMPSDLRVLAALTETEAATAAGIPTYTYGRIERGMREPAEEIAARIAATLGVSAAEYLRAWRRARDRPPGAPA